MRSTGPPAGAVAAASAKNPCDLFGTILAGSALSRLSGVVGGDRPRPDESPVQYRLASSPSITVEACTVELRLALDDQWGQRCAQQTVTTRTDAQGAVPAVL